MFLRSFGELAAQRGIMVVVMTPPAPSYQDYVPATKAPTATQEGTSSLYDDCKCNCDDAHKQPLAPVRRTPPRERQPSMKKRTRRICACRKAKHFVPEEKTD